MRYKNPRQCSHAEKKVTSAAGRAKFAVEDDGAGIDEAALPYLFEDKPLSVSGWLKYTPGDEFYDENGQIIDQQDLGTVNVVLYEVSSEDETLNGSNIYTSENICAAGSYETAGAEEFTEFNITLDYIKDYDSSKTYKLAVIFAASKEGNQYRAAKGSIMVVDNVTIICE